MDNKETKQSEKQVYLGQKEVDLINRYIIDTSAYIPGKVKSSAKWQADSSRVLRTLGIS